MKTLATRPAPLHPRPALSLASESRESNRCRLCVAGDETLVVEIREGRQDAVEHFFDRYFGLIFRIAVRILRDEGEAQDTTQEVFFQFVHSIHLYDQSKGSPRTWVQAIAYHRSLDRRQYLNLRRFYDQVEVAGGLEESLGAAPHYEPPGILAERDLGPALAVLSHAQRMTIELYCFEGLTFREIAARLDTTLPNIRHHYYRGIEKLRATLITQTRSKTDRVAREESV